jgi:nitrogen regulatory protein P-II 1
MEENRKLKLIIAFVKPFRLEDVQDAMEGVGVDSFSFAEFRGIGRHVRHQRLLGR